MRWVKGCLVVFVLAGFVAGELSAGETEFKPGEGWVQLFNGKDLSGWKFRGKNVSCEVVDGVMANTKRGANIYTEQKFLDFQLHIEFKIRKGGNSGVYLRGRKEVQIDDAYGRGKPGSGSCGGIYGRAAPKVNACKPAGQWNSFDITVVGDKITAIHNGQTIHDAVEVKGRTGGSMGGKEGTPGPVMLQLDHGPVWYRNIWIKPLPKKE